EDVRQFMAVCGKQVRSEFGDHFFDYSGEFCYFLCKCNLLNGFKIVTFTKGACFFKNTTCPCMGILNIWAALAFKVKSLVPVKNRAFLGGYLYNIVPDACPCD